MNDKTNVRTVIIALALLAGTGLLCGTFLLWVLANSAKETQAALSAAVGVVFTFASGAAGALGALLASTRTTPGEP